MNNSRNKKQMQQIIIQWGRREKQMNKPMLYLMKPMNLYIASIDVDY